MDRRDYLKTAGIASTVGVAGAVALGYRRRPTVPNHGSDDPPLTSKLDGRTSNPESVIAYADGYATVIRATEHGVFSNSSESTAKIVNTTIASPDGEAEHIDRMDATDGDFTPR